MNLLSKSFRVKNDDTTYTTNDILPNAANDDLLRFGEAYNSLQENKDPSFFIRSVYEAV